MLVIDPCVGSAMAAELGDVAHLVRSHFDDRDPVVLASIRSKVSGTPMWLFRLPVVASVARSALAPHAPIPWSWSFRWCP